MIPACPPPIVDTQLQAGVRAFGQQLGGLAVIHLDATTYALTMLVPTGMELFTISGPPQVVAAGVAAWGPWLAKMPVERDLRLVFTPTDTDRCDAGTGRIRQRLTDTGWVRRWSGTGGGARAVRDGDTVQLRATGYQLTFILPPVAAPVAAPTQAPPQAPIEAPQAPTETPQVPEVSP